MTDDIIEQVIDGITGFVPRFIWLHLIAFLILPVSAMQELAAKFGIVCMEDMVHEIENVGPHFKEVVRFMLPFELNKPSDDGFKG